MLVINSNETNDKIQLSSENISIEINNEDRSHNILDKSSTIKDLEITDNLFDDVLNITKITEKQFKKKSIWDIDVPIRDLKKYLFSYYQKKIKLNNQQSIQRINKITNIFYNLIDNLQNDSLQFQNILQSKSKNKQLDYFKNHKQFGIDWIYPIVNDRKKLYKYLKPPKKKR